MASKAQKRLNKLMNVKNRIAREGERQLRAAGGPIRKLSIFNVQAGAFDAARKEIETGVKQALPTRPDPLTELRRMLRL